LQELAGDALALAIRAHPGFQLRRCLAFLFMFGPTPFRDIFLVAGFELREMRRSRRLLLAGALYMLVAAFGSYTFVDFLARVQPLTNMADNARNQEQYSQYGPPSANRPPPTPTSVPATAPATPAGDSTAPSQGKLFQRGSPFRGLLRGAVTGQAAQDFLLSQPPIVLFHMLVSLAILPLVTMLTSSESISQEHQSRGVRFIALRTGRAEFVLGKVVGQGFTIALLTLLGGFVCVSMAAWKLQDFAFWPTLYALLLFWPRIVVYCVAFLGLASLCSMNSSTPVASRIFSIVALASLLYLNSLCLVYLTGLDPAGAEAHLLKALDFLIPYSHEYDLWYPELATYGGAMAALVFIGLFFTAIGLIFYRKRDL
jgi:ABC-type transport system involved in multi-copper enzyme maturation permease subunit